MANLSVTDRVALEQQEALLMRLMKAEAMAHMTMNNEFLEHDNSLIHAYLWGLSDTISEARVLSEQSFNALLKETM
jgi:hypothetical protein